MPVLDPELRTTPRSARYQPHSGQALSQPGPFVARRSRVQPDARFAAAKVSPDTSDQDDVLPWQRRAVTPSTRRERGLPGHTRRRAHPFLFICIGLLAAILLWIGVSRVIAWGNGVWDQLRYGNPRTYQTDAVVGQDDTTQHPSHFIALNLHGQIVILDFPAGDPTKAREFTVSSILGPNAAQVVVTLHFVDINHNGKPDMIIDAGGAQIFLVNADGTFQPPTPAEQQQILQALSSWTVVNKTRAVAYASEQLRVLATTSILGSNADQVVVTLRFIDVNHTGKPDMLIHINGGKNVPITIERPSRANANRATAVLQESQKFSQYISVE